LPSGPGRTGGQEGGATVIDAADVQDLIGRWWYHYDQAEFEELEELLTEDMRFTCQTDTGATDFEEFVRADIAGRAEVMRWQRPHRMGSPYPLRHHGTNIHVTRRGADDADFASYILVMQTVDMYPAPIPGGIVTGTVRRVDGVVRLAQLNVVLDTEDSTVLSERATSPS
jgi:hypothetical protein